MAQTHSNSGCGICRRCLQVAVCRRAPYRAAVSRLRRGRGAGDSGAVRRHYHRRRRLARAVRHQRDRCIDTTVSRCGASVPRGAGCGAATARAIRARRLRVARVEQHPPVHHAPRRAAREARPSSASRRWRCCARPPSARGFEPRARRDAPQRDDSARSPGRLDEYGEWVYWLSIFGSRRPTSPGAGRSTGTT